MMKKRFEIWRVFYVSGGRQYTLVLGELSKSAALDVLLSYRVQHPDEFVFLAERSVWRKYFDECNKLFDLSYD